LLGGDRVVLAEEPRDQAGPSLLGGDTVPPEIVTLAALSAESRRRVVHEYQVVRAGLSENLIAERLAEGDLSPVVRPP